MRSDPTLLYVSFSVCASGLCIVAYLMGRQHLKRRAALHQTMSEDVLGLLREGQLGRANSIANEIGGGFAREIHDVLVSQAQVGRLPAPDVGEDLPSRLPLWTWILRSAVLVSAAFTLSPLAGLGHWWYYSGSRYGGGSTWAQVLPILCRILIPVLPCALSLVCLRRFGDMEWWDASRRAELLIDIRKAATSVQQPPVAQSR